MSTEGNSFFLICQMISGPRMFPNGTPTQAASALKWQSMFQVRAWLAGPGGGVGDEVGGVTGGGSMGGGAWFWFSDI